MTYHDIEQAPELQELGRQYREQHLHFSGYINFAIGKAMERVGKDAQEEVIAIAVEILEQELKRFVAEKLKAQTRTNPWFGMLRKRQTNASFPGQ